MIADNTVFKHSSRAAAAVAVVVVLGVATPVRVAAQTGSQPAGSSSIAGSSSVDGGHSTFPATRASVSIHDLFAGTIADFRHLPSWPNLAILTVGGIGAIAEHSADRQVSTAMFGSGRLNGVLGAGERLGSARTQLAAALATYAVGRISGNSKATLVGADLIRAQLVTQALTAGIKMSVNRTRPDGTQYSFPSGHASVTFATATVLQRDLGWKVGVPAYGLATYVAASRVQDKRHFLSDVTFGAAIGIVAGRSVTIGHGNARFALSPVAAPGGGGVGFTWVGHK